MKTEMSKYSVSSAAASHHCYTHLGFILMHSKYRILIMSHAAFRNQVKAENETVIRKTKH